MLDSIYQKRGRVKNFDKKGGKSIKVSILQSNILMYLGLQKHNTFVK